MKSILIASCSLFLGYAPSLASNISSAGVDGADGGLLKIDQADPYWWFCVQPDGSEGPLGAGPAGYTADIVTLDYGWTRQTTDRFTFSGNAPQAAQDDLLLQVNAIEYVLDTYLPWSETTDNFLNQVAVPAGSTDQAANVNFFNRFYAAQQYIKVLHSKLYTDTTSFTDLSVFDPVNPFGTGSLADIARGDFFDQIKADINLKDLGNFFTSYDPVHSYAMVNTYQPQGSPLDWQDAVILGAVPEPSAGLLALGSLLLLGNRRRRA